MGINLGDITDNGDGVNIAARLEGLSKNGGVCISGSVHDQVHNKLDLGFKYLGEQELKHIVKPLRVYQIVSDYIVSNARNSLFQACLDAGS